MAASRRRRWLVDMLVLWDADVFVYELRGLVGGFERVVEPMAQLAAVEGGPHGGDKVLRAWVLSRLAHEPTLSDRVPTIARAIREHLFSLQASLEASLERSIGGGELSPEAAVLLTAVVRALCDHLWPSGKAPMEAVGRHLSCDELDELGKPLLGVSFDGASPFRVVTTPSYSYVVVPRLADIVSGELPMPPSLST